MAYAAVISVLETLIELQDESKLQNIPYPRSEVRTLENNLTFLQSFMKAENPGVEDLEVEIRERMYEAQDALDSNISNFILNSKSADWVEDNYISSFSRDLEKVNADVGFVTAAARMLSPIDVRPLLLMPPPPQVSHRSSIVGREADLFRLKSSLIAPSSALHTVSVFGDRGIGKTHLVQTVYDDPDIVWRFKTRAWAEVPQFYSKKEVLITLLRCMKGFGSGKGQEIAQDKLAKRLSNYLSQGSYLIVLDGVCNPEAWDNLKELFPDWGNGSRVMITTRPQEVAQYAKIGNKGSLEKILPLDGEEPWDLLQSVVFRYKACPEKLVATAKRVSANCKGLPLAIVTIGGVLMEAGTKDWEIAASSLTGCGDCDELIDAVMSLSYKSLPQYAKACLFYMAIFPNNYDIPLSKLYKLWIAEGFIDKNDKVNSLEKMCEECLSLLDKRGIVFVSERNHLGKIRTCRVDGVYHDFLKKKAKEDKFFHVINGYMSSFPDKTWTHERFLIRENVQFADGDVLKSENPAPTVRSMLFDGAHEQNPMWVHLDFKLLRVLDALKIRFYGFPDEILKLIHLRYLALTYPGEIPEEICGLWNLQFLIILRQLSSKTSEVVSRLPLEIWNMSELRHLQLIGRDLPAPSTSSPKLENLITLLDVSSHSCTPEILKRIPNLKKFGVRIESPALDAAEDMSFLSHLTLLGNLESFKCVVMHPDFESQVASPNPNVSFPATVTKISLSGCGLSWENMKTIAKLPKLKSLKLRWYAFRGSEWKQEGDGKEHKGFPKLTFLLLEDLDIQSWKTSSGHFPWLQNLVIRHCYKLKEIPAAIGNIPSLKKIELVDCNSSALKSAEKIKEVAQQSRGHIGVHFHSSHDD
ncbi:putative late blight resistance protein homolog R1A-10 [Salvia splendens]|uniref:putative late blight resistance protein homolog R1A-10 n=1 Tax=Salvia splendens TaxID=180675 RepID=UPI001C27F337|nr:putative late blight resistance protein homolog R1A-10 [Salvia splendens]